MIELGLLLLAGLAVAAVILFVAVAKVVLWVLLLPLRLLFWIVGGLILLPLLLAKALVGGVLLILALPFIALAAAIGLAVGAVFLLIPLLPLILLGMLVWVLVRGRSEALVRT
jgi:hypothetical protein